MTSSLQPDPSAIGRIPAPPFARLPDPEVMFAQRAKRLLALAEVSDLGAYLSFVAALAQAQHDIQSQLPEPSLPDEDALARAREFAMPPIDRSGLSLDPAVARTLDLMFDAAASIDKPKEAEVALGVVRQAGPGTVTAMIRNVLSEAIPADAIAEHAYVAGGLQAHVARLAARLDGEKLVRVSDGVCPACGGPPVSSLIVGWMGAEGARYCCCSLCGTFWNVVRIKCVLCSSTKGVGYREIDGGPGTIKAECCDTCHGYVKVFYQQKDVSLDPVADDIASLGLDLLLRDSEYRRGSFNPFLLGF
ncbi:formate dehydrogenase accessory protein FdhE [Microvirga terricola]|uniref:Protein FdhE homolog n=1 Tax=Microvirga terricola TaxID=2719797 RepID=A0ABX0VDF4_9HYPH|nr:formate dehydrogenase accessory protein FdhE [Microvirga terricola]NIX77486.1 formate dehydrogenase accessory protein FdhE [Microvirga terricola]